MLSQNIEIVAVKEGVGHKKYRAKKVPNKQLKADLAVGWIEENEFRLDFLLLFPIILGIKNRQPFRRRSIFLRRRVRVQWISHG